MARIIAIILCMTLIVGACVVAVGSTFFGWDIFGEQTEDPHTHQYSEEITKAPTCTEEGVKTFTCSGEGCDKPTYTEPIEKIPHTEVKLDGKAATCTEDGLSEGKKCSACGETTVKQDTIPATGHKEETLAAVAPTCTENGLTAGKKCSACGTVLTAQNTAPATGHKYDDNYDATCNNEGCDFVRDADCRHSNTEVLAAEAATCTKTGLTEGLKCKDCEDILTKQDTIPMLAHSWTSATCTAPKTCSVCSATEGDELGHNWKPATCTDPKTCQRENCGVTEGEKLGHKWNDATCTAPQICSVCTVTQGEKLGHDWADATCDTPKTCGTCKATEGGKLGHDYDAATYVWSEDNKTCTATKVCKNDASHVVTEPATATIQTASATCITAGTVTYTATFKVEGFVTQTETITTDKLEHIIVINYKWSSDFSSCTAEEKCDRVGCTYSAGETNTASSKTTLEATCAKNGTMLYTVKFVNYPTQTKEKTIPATGAHTEEIIPAISSTCITHGKTEGKKCSVCGTILQAQGEAPLAAHTYTDKYDATCNVEGCNFVRDAECAHTKTITLDEVPATCLETGLKAGVQCANEKCGEILSGRETIPARGHDWKAATCFDPKTCQRAGCDETEGDKLPHEWQDPTYSWNEDNTQCTATINCANGHSVEHKSTTVTIDSREKTCLVDGYVKYTAVFANAELNVTKTIVDKFTGHSYTPTVTDPTCTVGGITTWNCSKCTDSYTTDPTTKLGHEFKTYVSNNDAKCEIDGTKTAKCERCDETDTVADVGSAKDHSFTDYKSNNDATCTADGTETAKCDRCTVTDTRTDADSKLDHTYNKKNTADEYLESAATCTAKATYYYSCSCGAKGTETFDGTTTDPTNHTGTEVNGGTENVHTKYSCCGVTISSNHKYESKVTTPATCTEKGTTTYTCDCGYHYDAQDVTALGHNYTEKITDEAHLKTAAENCQQVNVYWYDCSRCAANAKDDATAADKYYNSDIAGAHKVSEAWTNEDGKHLHKCEYCDYTKDEGTCSDVDTDTDHNCDVCDAEDITSHTYNQTVANDTYKATDATCTAKATYYKSCKCGATGTETFESGEKLAHSYGTPSYEWADDYSTCTATKVCVNGTCGDTVTETVNATSECTATCTAAGKTTYTATFNGETFEIQTEIVNTSALGHTATGVCERCGRYIFANYTAGEQYKEETHKLDDNTELYIIKCHLHDDDLRIYSSSENNGVAIIKSKIAITSISLTAGYKSDTVVIYGSNDEGTTWIEIGKIAADSYKEISCGFTNAYKWIKLDVAGTQQIRIRTMLLGTCEHKTETTPVCNAPATCTECGVTVYGTHTEVVDAGYAASCLVDGKTEGKHCSSCNTVLVAQTTITAPGHTEETITGTSATCGAAGLTDGVKCSVCKEIITEQEVIPATGNHTYDNDEDVTCNGCDFVRELECEHTETEEIPAVAPTCTKAGSTAGVKCANDNCNHVITAPTEVPATGHEDTTGDFLCDNVNNGLDCDEIAHPEADSVLTIEQAIALGQALGNGNTSTNNYYVTGVVYNVYNTTYGNMYLVNSFVDNEAQFQIYGLYKDSVSDSNKYGNMETKPIQGDTITIYGKIGNYNGTSQMASALLDEHVQHGENHQWSEATCLVASICSICGKTGEKADHVDANGDKVCDVEGCETPVGVATKEVWQLVTDISQLEAGKQIIIVANTEDYAMSTTQNSNNRGQVAITKDGNTVIIVDNVQIITLENGTTSGTYAFNVGNGYLYAASSSSNYLKTKTSIDGNASWAITITDGVASIIAQGTYTRNVMQYNASSKLFACYASASQKAISIYVKTVIADSGSDETPDCESEKCTECGGCPDANCEICETKCEGHNTQGGGETESVTMSSTWDFSENSSATSYTTKTSVDNNGITWTATYSAYNSSYPNAIVVANAKNTTSPGTLKSSVIDGGIKSLSFKWIYPNSDKKGFSFTINIYAEDGTTLIGTATVVNSTAVNGTEYTVNNVTFVDGTGASANIKGKYILEFVNNQPSGASSSSNCDRAAIYGLTWETNP